MPYRRVGLALLMAAALGAGVLTPKALADSNARIVRLSYVDGGAQIDNRDGRGFERAFLNMPLVPGTRVATRDDGRAEIEFEDGSTVRLAPNTLAETQGLELRSSGGKSTLVDLQEGTAYFNIRKLNDDDDFRVTTGQREFSLTRASRFRVRVDRSQVLLAVFKGEVEVTGQGGRLTVRKNETLTLDLDDPARYFLAKGVSADRYDDWDRDRDEYRDQYANVGNYRGYSSAYSYGLSDLNYWGAYSYIPGYGYMWRPYYYGVGWDPFLNGAWYWYPGYGWVWVSPYPWGWMPFRYGGWYFVTGYGWCWRPGRRWTSWSPVVVAHNAPPGHVVPVAPPPTARRNPVIVGQGPQTILPPQDPGPLVLHRRDGSVVVGRGGAGGAGSSGSGATATPGSGPGAAAPGQPGASLAPVSGSGAPAASGGSGQPAADSSRRPAPVPSDSDLEEKIRDARDRRISGSGAPVAGSGSASSGSSSSGAGAPPVSGGGQSPGAGASSPGASAGPDPVAGRSRLPEPRRTPSTEDSGRSSAGSVPSSSGSSVGSSAASPPPSSPGPAPAPPRATPSEPRHETPHENISQGSGSSSPGWSGGGGGSSSRSSSASSSGGSRSSAGGSSYSAGGGGRSSGGSSSGSSHTSSGGRSSSFSSKGSSPR